MKKIISLIAFCTFIIALSACSSNSNSSSGYKYKDLGRSCGVAGCWNDAATDEMLCDEHIAEMNGEIDLCKHNGCTFEASYDGYCATHKHKEANEGYDTCLRDGCMEEAEENSLYCAIHGY